MDCQNEMEVNKEKDVNTINANDNLETEETGANANDTSNNGTMRKKASKERKKAGSDKREREHVGGYGEEEGERGSEEEGE